MSPEAGAGSAAVILAIVHAVARRFEHALDVVPRSRWLSAAGGVSVAYVFVHLLPEIAASQRELANAGTFFTPLESELWLGALAGLTVFYGLERATTRRPRAPDSADATGWVHLASYASYNVVAGYVLLAQAEQGATELALYTVAIGVHFLVNDHALIDAHGPLYRARGRWLVAGGVILGWLLSLVELLHGAALGWLLAFLGGAIVLNVLKEELPEERQSRFVTFAVAAAAYAALLVIL